MTITKNLFFLFAVTVFALTSVVLATFNYSPYTASFANFVNFYSSFWVALSGVTAISIFYLASPKAKDMPASRCFWRSIRQAAFLSAAVTIILLLKGLDILDLLIGTSVVIVFLLLELFFRTKKNT